MAQFLLVLAVALTVGAIVFGFTVLVTGQDGLSPAEPDGRVVPLPGDRPLAEPDLGVLRFDVGWRGYRMAQVDAALRRAAYDIGYKDELVKVLQAEVDALRAGRTQDAEVLRRAREAALESPRPTGADAAPAGAEPEPEPEAGPDLASDQESKAGADPEPRAGSVPAPDAQARVGSEPEPNREVNPDPEPDSEPEPAGDRGV